MESKIELMKSLLNLYEQVDNVTMSETKLIIKEFIDKKEKMLMEVLSND